MYMDPGEKDTHDAWVAGLADSLGKDEAGGYVGFLGEEDEAGPLPTRARPGTGSAVQAPVRPRQPFPPQPQHSAGGRLSLGVGSEPGDAGSLQRHA